MIVFIIPLKSPELTNSWELLSKLFERTIKSVFRQTSDNFRVIVVCHQKPDIAFQDPRLIYIEVDFPVPKNDRKSKRDDKKAKIRVGLFHSQLYNPTHTMVVNADDCLTIDRLPQTFEMNLESIVLMIRFIVISNRFCVY